MSEDQHIIQIYFNMRPLLLQRNSMLSVSEEKTLGLIASSNGKPISVTKQTIKMTGLLNKRNMKIKIFEINRKMIITLLNKMPYLSDSRHL